MRNFLLIPITKSEAEYLRTHGKGKSVHMTSKTHKGKAKKYFLEENEKCLKFLEEYRQSLIKK